MIPFIPGDYHRHVLCSQAPEALWGTFHPSLINLKILKELWLQQEIGDTHNNKQAYSTWPVWDSKNHIVSADLIKQHFCQILGMDSAPCTYLICKHVIPPTPSSSSVEHVELFDNQMIKHFPIIKQTELLANLSILDMEPPLKLYAYQVAEDIARCFQELKRIVQGTEAKVYVDNLTFNVHFESQAAWMNLCNTFLGSGAKDLLAAQLEKTIQNLQYKEPKSGLTFNTYIECHKTIYQSILALVKKTNYSAYDPSTQVFHFINGITDPELAQSKLSLNANHVQYSCNVDATIEYLMNQVSHHQVNQQFSTPGHLKTHNDHGRELEMPANKYSCEEWAQLLLDKKTIIQKCRAKANGNSHRGCGGWHGGGNCTGAPRVMK